MTRGTTFAVLSTTFMLLCFRTVVFPLPQPVCASPEPSSWILTIHITEPGGAGNTVTLGQTQNATDGQDATDIPEPPAPPQFPFISSWFQTPFPAPFNNLREEYKAASTPESTWNLSILWVPMPGNATTTTITLQWDPATIADNLSSCLLSHNTTVLANMRTQNTYSYDSNGSLATFQIISHTKAATNTTTTMQTPLPLVIGVILVVLLVVLLLAVLLVRKKK